MAKSILEVRFQVIVVCCTLFKSRHIIVSKFQLFQQKVYFVARGISIYDKGKEGNGRDTTKRIEYGSER